MRQRSILTVLALLLGCGGSTEAISTSDSGDAAPAETAAETSAGSDAPADTPACSATAAAAWCPKAGSTEGRECPTALGQPAGCLPPPNKTDPPAGFSRWCCPPG